jgi:uncharacterized Zn finger protein
MPGRENVQTKAHRLLKEGRITVHRVGDGSRIIYAQARGDSAHIYDLGYDPRNQGWRCTCEARGECSHLVALKLITLEPERT